MAAASTTAVARDASPKEMFQCGGVTEAAKVQRYFRDLRAALMSPGSGRRFNLFVGAQFEIRDREGKTLHFNLEDVGAVSPGYITVEEWREISGRGAANLHDAGYRGCFLDNGKVWFEASEERGFRLILIARDMSWSPPTKPR